MGKFSDTKYIKTIDSLVDATKDKLNNPYYLFADRKPTKVTYYNQNVEKSTLDEASGLYGAHIGKDSPFKFNKINDFLLYGLGKITTDYDVGEFGTESSNITGDCIILPNTIEPKPGDFFYISYIKENVLFKVTTVSADTLDTGANIYRLEYSLEHTNAIEQIESQVEKRFNFLVNNIGTDFKAIIQDCDYDIIEKLECLVESLIVYFNNIFFSPRLQTYVYNHDGWMMYDPFVIEFFIRNDVLKFGEEYQYVSHACSTNKTFGMDYTKTFFNCLEHPDQDIKCSTIATADMITDPNSLFAARLEYYYSVNYIDNTPYKTRFHVLDMDIIEHIKNNEMYEKGNNKEIYNLWIAFFNNNKDFITGDIISLIKNADYMDNMSCFYTLAVSIYILEQYMKNLLAK